MRSKILKNYTIKIRTNYSGFQINENSPWYMFASASLTEEGVETVISTSDSFVRRHLTVRLDAMFQTVQLPAGVTDLYTSLSNMD